MSYATLRHALEVNLSSTIHTFIDAENLDPALWGPIKGRLANLGSMASIRIFGDFSDGQRKRWLKIARTEGIEVVMNLGGTNACDISIAMAAMDLLHTVRPTAICLVSSDRDYAPLALRLRHEGLGAHGIGEAKASAEYRKAFTTFTVLKKPKAAQPAKTAA
jgi:hypothetical protein